MAAEGVVDALRAIHAALVPGGIVVDTQPISPRPAVEVRGDVLGRLDMREWEATIETLDRRADEVLGDGLFAIDHVSHFMVTDTFDGGGELLDVVGSWQGTRVPAALARRAARRRAQVAVHQRVRLRLLRALD